MDEKKKGILLAVLIVVLLVVGFFSVKTIMGMQGKVAYHIPSKPGAMTPKQAAMQQQEEDRKNGAPIGGGVNAKPAGSQDGGS